MSFFDRLANLWTGFWSLFLTTQENKNPEIVYESAINARVQQHAKLKAAVGGIVALRNKLTRELEVKEGQLKEVMAQIPVAVDAGDDEVALVLLQQKNEIEPAIAALKADLEKVTAQAEDAKNSLIEFRGEIDKLKREKDEMLAKKATAEARLQIQATLDGLSTDADIKALEGVREGIHKLAATADVGTEMKDSSLDARLKKVKERAVDHVAKAQLDELKRLQAAKQASASGAAVTKTI